MDLLSLNCDCNLFANLVCIPFANIHLTEANQFAYLSQTNGKQTFAWLTIRNDKHKRT